MDENQKKPKSGQLKDKKVKITDPRRKRPRPDRVNVSRRSIDDPFKNILNQHRDNRIRVLMITGLIFGIIVIVSGISFLYGQWKLERKRQAHLNNLIAELENNARVIENRKGYEKNRAVVDALNTLARIRDFDSVNYRKWEADRQEYFNRISGTVPDPAKAENFINPVVLADMVYIPAGKFKMGKRPNEYGDKDELPRHTVTISHPFWMGRTEVSNAEFRRLFPHHHIRAWSKHRYVLDSPAQPVVKVDWHTAMAFCRMINEREKRAGRVPNGYEYRLPTEAEWEYACRAGTQTQYFWGNGFGKLAGKYANSLDMVSARIFGWEEAPGMTPNDGFRVSSPVSDFIPNAFGLHNSSGNVWEWCFDWYNPKAYSELPATDPAQTSPVECYLTKRKPFELGEYTIKTTCKVIRGGSWGNLPEALRSADRDYREPAYQNEAERNTGIGFRIVLAPEIK